MLASAIAAADVVTLRVLLPPGGLVAGSSIDPPSFATASAAASAGASSATPLLRSVIVNVSTTVALASHNGELIHPQSVVLTNGVGVVSRLEFDPSKCSGQTVGSWTNLEPTLSSPGPGSEGRC